MVLRTCNFISSLPPLPNPHPQIIGVSLLLSTGGERTQMPFGARLELLASCHAFWFWLSQVPEIFPLVSLVIFYGC